MICRKSSKPAAAETARELRRTDDRFGQLIGRTLNTTKPNAQQKPLRIVVAPTSNNRWSAKLNGETLCTAAAPLVMAARVLMAEGYSTVITIEMLHIGHDAWSLRGKLGDVARVRLEGEASRRARNGPPIEATCRAATPAAAKT